MAYSKSKGHLKTAERTTPVWFLVVLSFLNRKFNWGMDDALMGVIVGGFAYIYFFIVNWFKNRNLY